jgi:hypothetical protein
MNHEGAKGREDFHFVFRPYATARGQSQRMNSQADMKNTLKTCSMEALNAF